ncbi:mitochondrial import inner membrane translocase subunit tim8 [Ophiostoma piceae UAMH 11346]|uniref:Mitochondrial import inner membrane translocase subunit n=1 Tax=Ophiostoma piceae (strain UAMH 11346) TaxID=1262450 RepID=S3CL86_OPHP1|nr:mitochondrial import inner membrane translocase subunit tim8 [Ophiostoma piceae UAMH 11346]
MATIDQEALSNLSDKDKLELRGFLAAESQRTGLQGQIHNLTDKCFKKCAATTSGNTLSSTEKDCMSNCAANFIDFTILTTTSLAKLRR